MLSTSSTEIGVQAVGAEIQQVAQRHRLLLAHHLRISLVHLVSCRYRQRFAAGGWRCCRKHAPRRCGAAGTARQCPAARCCRPRPSRAAPAPCARCRAGRCRKCARACRGRIRRPAHGKARWPRNYSRRDRRRHGDAKLGHHLEQPLIHRLLVAADAFFQRDACRTARARWRSAMLSCAR